jgi:hypothetical protein
MQRMGHDDRSTCSACLGNRDFILQKKRQCSISLVTTQVLSSKSNRIPWANWAR